MNTVENTVSKPIGKTPTFHPFRKSLVENTIKCDTFSENTLEQSS